MRFKTNFLFFFFCVESSIVNNSNCCEKIAISDCERSDYNGVYSTTGQYNGKDYYVKENGQAYIYFSAVSNSWHINYNLGNADAVIKGECCYHTCPSYENWQEQLFNGQMVNLNTGTASNMNNTYAFEHV